MQNKETKNYSINKNWMDYRTMAKLLSENGPDINHNSARNWVLKALELYAIKLAKRHESKINPIEIAKNPMFQEAIYIHLLENIDKD